MAIINSVAKEKIITELKVARERLFGFVGSLNIIVFITNSFQLFLLEKHYPDSHRLDKPMNYDFINKKDLLTKNLFRHVVPGQRSEIVSN